MQVPLDSPAATGRIAWMDYARGIAIILVVYGHCFRGLQSAGYLAAGGALATVDYVIYGFHMPLFFFLSGVVSAKAFTMAAGPFFRSRIVAIGWPYLLWMSIEIALLKAFSGVTNLGALPVGPATYLIEPISPFWFLYALFMANLAVYCLRTLPRPALLAVTAVIFAAGQFAPLPIVPQVSWGLFYFALGLCCSGWVRKPGFIRSLSSPAALLCSAASTVGLSLIFLKIHLDYRLEVPVAITGSALVFGIAYRLANGADQVRPLAVVSLLGQISLTVLVIHVLGTAGTRIVLSKALHLHAAAVQLTAGTITGLVLPLMLQWCAARTGLLRALGLPVLKSWPPGRLRSETAPVAMPPQSV